MVTHILVHRSARQLVHNELAELVTIVAVDGVCQTDDHFKVIHVYVPARMIGEQTEGSMSVLLVCDTFYYIERIIRNTVADETKSMSAISSTIIQTSSVGMVTMPPSVILMMPRSKTSLGIIEMLVVAIIIVA